MAQRLEFRNIKTQKSQFGKLSTRRVPGLLAIRYPPDRDIKIGKNGRTICVRTISGRFITCAALAVVPMVSRRLRNALRSTTADHRLQVGLLWFSGMECIGRNLHNHRCPAVPRGAPNPCKSRAVPGPPADEYRRYHCRPHQSWAQSSGKSGRAGLSW